MSRSLFFARLCWMILFLLCVPAFSAPALQSDARNPAWARSVQLPPVENFFEVAPGLFRSAQPSGKAMQALEKNEQSNRRIFVESWNAGQVFLRIRDNGPGISPEVGEKIFEPFVSTKSGEENMGLGLAIVRNMVAVYGGTIVLEQAHTVGASFVVSFPAHLQAR